MLEWLSDNEVLAWWFAIISVVTFVATLIAVPIAVVKIPADYFAQRHHRPLVAADRPLLRSMWAFFKTLLGVTLVLMGVLMLVLPGQGIITILVGIMLLNFPGRHKLQCWIISRRPVLNSINWLRRRAGRQPLQVDLRTQC